MCGTCDGHVHGEALPAGTLEITILADGRVRIDTGSFAGAAHASAQAAIPAIAAALGVTVESAKKRVAQAWTEATQRAQAHNHGHNG
jgi:hypothetical protein